MGRPNDPCFKKPAPYLTYAETVTTTTLSPEDIDFFILPQNNVPCPEKDSLYQFTPKYKQLSNLFTQVSTVRINVAGCEPYSLNLTGNDKDFFELSNSGLYFNYTNATARNYSVTVSANNLLGSVLSSANFSLGVNVLACSTTTGTTGTTGPPITTTLTPTSTSTSTPTTTSVTSTSTTDQPPPPTTTSNPTTTSIQQLLVVL
jgi:hypothetical protein